MSDEANHPDVEGTRVSDSAPASSEGVTVAATESVQPVEEGPTNRRRQFVTGVMTTLGAVGGAALLGSSKTTAETDAVQLRSQIVSRIQEELKRSKADLMNNYDRPDSPGGTHGRYLKAV